MIQCFVSAINSTYSRYCFQSYSVTKYKVKYGQERKKVKSKLLTILIFFCTLTDFKLLFSSSATRLGGRRWLVAANVYRNAILAIQALISATVVNLRSWWASILAAPAS